MATKFEFITTDPATSLKPGKSSTIRSRCMLGKNKREGSRRSIRDKKKRELAETENQIIVHIRSTVPLALDSRSTVQFAGKVDDEGRALIFRAFNFDNNAPDLSPLDRYIEFDWSESISLEWVFTDSVFMHLMLYASYGFCNLAMPNCDNRTAMKAEHHLHETLFQLAKMLDDATSVESEVVLSVVIYLALLAAMHGDWRSAAAHFAGLQRIVQLRGGMRYLRSRPSLLFKLSRLDMAWAMGSGKSPFFLCSPDSWSSALNPRTSMPPGLYEPPHTWDGRLTAVFLDLQYLSITVSDHARRTSRYNSLCFQSTLSSNQSRLMAYANEFTDPVQELVRLALLGFLTTTFRLPEKHVPYPWIRKELQKAYERAGNAIRVDETLNLWVLTMTAISVSGAEESWLQDEWWQAEGWKGKDWDGVKGRLEKVMWFEVIHDEQGMSVWQRLCAVGPSTTDEFFESAIDGESRVEDFPVTFMSPIDTVEAGNSIQVG